MARMDLKTCLGEMGPLDRESFALKCGTSIGHLANVSYGKTCGPALAVAIERESCGQVTRADLRPHDYWLIWPDLKAPADGEAKVA